MRFRRWVVFTFAIHVLVILLDKGAGLILLSILKEDTALKGAADILTTLPFIMMAVANLGLATSSVYFLRRKEYGLREVAETTSLVALVWGGIVAGLAILVSQTILPLLLPTWELRAVYVVPICLCVPFLLTTSYFNSLQLAVDRIRDYNLVHLIASISFLPLFFVFYFGVGAEVTTSIADARLAVAVVMTVVTLAMLRGLVKWRPRLHLPFFKAGITYGWKANITSVLTYLNHRFDLLLVAALFIGSRDAQLEQAAFYSLAVSFAELVWHFPEATRDLFFSKVAGATHEQAKSFTPILCRLSFTGAIVGGGAIYFLIWPLLSVIVGDQIGVWGEPVLSSFLILIPGTVAYTVAKVLQADLAARGHLNPCLASCTLVLVVMVGLDALWIPEYGAMGAAYASSIAYIASSIYSLVAYRFCGGGSYSQCLLVRPADWTYAVELYRAVVEKLRGKKS